MSYVVRQMESSHTTAETEGQTRTYWTLDGKCWRRRFDDPRLAHCREDVFIWPHLEIERASLRSALEFETLLAWRDICYWETCRFAHACTLDHGVCKADVARGDTHIASLIPLNGYGHTIGRVFISTSLYLWETLIGLWPLDGELTHMQLDVSVLDQ